MEKIYPLKFLKSYEKKDAKLFFGRDTEIDDLYDLVRHSKIVVVYGPSGTGKSSLIQCGLAGRFKTHDWHDIYIRRGSNINESFNDMIIKEGGTEGTKDIVRSFNEIYRGSFRPVYLFFDQFEELFILGSKAERDIFVATVKQILLLEQSVKMIFSIREEYLGFLSEFEKEIPRFTNKKLRIAPMDINQVQEVITGITTKKNPASLISLEAGKENEIAAKIFDKVAGIEKTRILQLPYLQVFMDKLYQEITHDPTQKTEALFSEVAVDKMGDIGDILRDFMEQQVAAISTELCSKYPAITRNDIWEILVPFVSLDGTKEPRTIQSLSEQLPRIDGALITEVVQKLSTAQVLRDAGGIYELAHDALAGKIVANRSEEYAAILRIEQIINSQVEIGKIAASSFLPENQLNIAELYWAQLEPRLSDEAKVFVKSSREHIIEEKEKAVAEEKRKADAIEKEKRNKRRRLVYTVSALLITAAVLIALKYKMDYERAQNKFLALCTGSTLSQYRYNDITKALRFATYAFEENSNADAAAIFYSVVFRNRDKLDYSFYRRSLQHEGQVKTVTTSKDGKLILTASEDYTAKIWNNNSGRLLVTLVGHTSTVNSAVFSPDNKTVLTASADGTAKIWSVDSGKQLHSFPAYTNKEGVNTAVFSPDGTLVITASRNNNNARVWNTRTGLEMTSLSGHAAGVFSAVFSADGKQALTASADKTAILWDVSTGNISKTFKGHTGPLHAAVFSPDGKTVFTTSVDSTIKSWNIVSADTITNFRGHTGEVWTIAFSPDSQKIITTADDKTARIWDIKTGKVLAVLAGHSNYVMSAVFSPNGNKILTSSLDFTAKMWDNSGKVLATLIHANGLASAAFSPDGSYVVTASADNTAKIWDTVDITERHMLSAHLAAVNAIAFSRSGKEVVKDNDDFTSKVLDTAAGIRITFAANDTFMSVVYSPDENKIITASKDNNSQLWDLATGKLLRIFSGHSDIVNYAAFSPDSKWVLTASRDKTARIWNVATGKCLHALEGHFDELNSAAFSTDGKFVLTASKDKTARLWETATGQCLGVLNGHVSWVVTAVFSPDGKQILTASRDNTAKIWDARTGKEIATLVGHTSGVCSGDFSKDGTKILTTSFDASAKIWDAHTHKELASIEDQKGVRSAFFSPDGKRILTIHNDNSIETRLISIPDIIKDLKNRTEDLSDAEKRNYGIPVNSENRNRDR